MTRNIMFPLTLKPTMKRKIMQAIYEAKYVHSDTAFTTLVCAVPRKKNTMAQSCRKHSNLKCRMNPGYGILDLDI
jgi:hypothetical protein